MDSAIFTEKRDLLLSMQRYKVNPAEFKIAVCEALELAINTKISELLPGTEWKMSKCLGRNIGCKDKSSSWLCNHSQTIGKKR